MATLPRRDPRTVPVAKPARWREMVAVACMVLAILLGLAFYVYDYRNTPDVSGAHPSTLVGSVGTKVAYVMVQCFGVAVYALPFLLACLAVMLVLRVVFPTTRALVFRALALLALLVTVAGMAALLHPHKVTRLNIGAGGRVGAFIGGDAYSPGLTYFLGSAGTGVILAGLMLIEILFLFDTSLRTLLQFVRGAVRYIVMAGRAVILLLAWIGNACRVIVRWWWRCVMAIVTWHRARRAANDRYETLITITGEPADRKPKPRVPKPKPALTPQPEPAPEPLPPPPPPTDEAGEPLPPYQKPSVSLLDPATVDDTAALQESVQQATIKLKETFQQFEIDADVVHAIVGPVITCYEVQPAPGVKVSKITSLENDIALAMKAKSIRIVAPIPGRDAVGIELPNEIRRIVTFSELMLSPQYTAAVKKMVLPLALGQTLSGDTFVDDLADMPHLLVAGATGSGKSVCINTILLSLLFRFEPHELKLVLVDPKHVELVPYHNLPHLLTPVLNEPAKVPEVLEWLIDEMDKRYKYFGRFGVRNIGMFNKKRLEDKRPLKIGIGSEEYDVPQFLPYIVVIIDELADLMLVAAEDIERKIIRLAQLARAAGIHLVLATQRPSTNVITGLIKANIPARVAFRTTSNIDSRVIIDEPGSEKLLGKGDMLYKAPSVSRTMRIQGAFVSEDEVKRVTDMIREQRAPQYIDLGELKDKALSGDMDMDDKFDEAVQATIESGQASASYLQRRLQVGYARAARLVDLMEAHGIVGPKRGAKPREILVDQWPPPSS